MFPQVSPSQRPPRTDQQRLPPLLLLVLVQIYQQICDPRELQQGPRLFHLRSRPPMFPPMLLPGHQHRPPPRSQPKAPQTNQRRHPPRPLPAYQRRIQPCLQPTHLRILQLRYQRQTRRSHQHVDPPRLQPTHQQKLQPKGPRKAPSRQRQSSRQYQQISNRRGIQP